MHQKDRAAVTLGSRGGKAKSATKAASSRRNGLLGGGMPKYQPGVSVTVLEGAPVALVGELGTVTAYVARSLYRVQIKGQEYELRSWWLRLSFP